MLTEIGVLIITDRKKAIDKITKAFVKAGGNISKTAGLLETDVRTVFRWVERLGIREELDREAEKHGFPAAAGPPRARSRILSALVTAQGQISKTAEILERDEEWLRRRIEQLDLYDEANRLLRAAGYEPLEKPERRRAS